MNTLVKRHYLSQRNNRLHFIEACNVTAAIMSFFQAGYKKELYRARDEWNRKNGTNWLQFEDALFDFMCQKKYRKHAKKLGSWNPNYYYEHPHELWQTLELGCNDFILPVVMLDWSISLSKIDEYIEDGNGFFISGNLPGTAGHFVNIGGVSGSTVTINDPWGDYTTEYADYDGYGVEMSFRDFARMMRKNSKTGYYEGFLVRKK